MRIKPTASQVAIKVTSATITIVINAAVSARTRQSIMPLPVKARDVTAVGRVDQEFRVMFR